VEFFYYLSSLMVALLVSAAIMPGVIRLAKRLDVLDRPGERRIHSAPIPRVGGIGIFFGYVAGVGAAMLLAGRATSLTDEAYYRWPGVALGMAVIFAAGLLDDIYHFRAQWKLALQMVAAALAIASGFRVDVVNVPLLGAIELGWLGPIVTFGWILLVTNAINLVDGLDGLAGGMALIVTSMVAAVALTMDQFGVVISAVALAGALLGFLHFNFPPARIFMGDGGSQFVGYTLAVISIRGSQKGATAVAIMVPILALGLPILDVATTIGRRARRDAAGQARGIGALIRRVARPDREHLHHNLLDLGVTPRRATLILNLVGALFALSGYLCLAQNSATMALFTLFLSVGAVAAIKLAFAATRGKVRPGSVPAPGSRPVTSD